MDAAAELGRNPVSKHQIQPEYGDYITNNYMHHKLHWIDNIIIFLVIFYPVANTDFLFFFLFSRPRAGLATV